MQYRLWQHSMISVVAVVLAGWAMYAPAQAVEISLPEAAASAPGTQPARQPASQPTSQPSTQPASQPASQPATQPVKLVPISFNNMPAPQIADFLTKNLGKPVIVSKEVEKIQVTLVNPKPMPLDQAMYILRTALLEQGVAIEERAETVHLVPVAQLISRQIPMIPADGDLTAIKPANQIVRKIFDVKRYNATKLSDVLKPLLPSYGHMIADPATGRLIIVATAEDLLLMSRVIDQMDKPDVSGRELRIFHVQNVDVYEIMPWLEKLVASFLGADAKAISSAGGSGPGRGPGGSSGMGDRGDRGDRGGSGDRGMGGPGGPGGPGGSGGPGGAGAGGATVVTVAADQQRPVLLLPDPRRSAIIIEAPSNVLAQVEVWLKELDQPKPPSTDVEIIEVQYGDSEDLASQLTSYLNNNPDESLRSTIRIFAIPGARRLMVRGSEQNRALVKGWLKEFDVDTGTLVTTSFTLKYADAQEIVENIKELFAEQKQRSSWYDDYFSSSSRNREPEKNKVTVTANVRKNSVTVKASPEKMKRISDQIKEWDKPFAGEEAAPRIYTLKYADPSKVCELLESLFVKKQKSTSWLDLIFDRDTSTPAPVGRLHGQFSFQAYPDLGKLVVVSKNEENYSVIDDMIEDIDQPQSAGIPRIIQLKYADAEPLAEQLNALLNAPGTQSPIVRQNQTPTFVGGANNSSPYASSNNNNNNANQRQQPSQPQQTEQGIMRFWWNFVTRDSDVKARQPSNLIGKLRIVPNIEQNLLLVTAPEDYADAIEELVAGLDKPGSQVLIKAVIAEITHEDATSLGYRFSSDPTLFASGNSLAMENALRGLLTYKFEDVFGTHNTVTFSADVNNLISLLRRVTDVKIRSEPAIFVADNVEGEFFDGQDIPFISNSQVSDLNVVTQSFDYKPVGITLRVRPHITTEGRVALTVTVTASSIVPGVTLFGGAIVDRRETNQRVELEDGKTFLISGMLRSEDRAIIRRVPGLGDIPGLGEIFKHREIAKVNTELLIFLTPYVICPNASRDVIEKNPMDRLRKHNMQPDDPPPAATQPCEEPAPSQAKARKTVTIEEIKAAKPAAPVDASKGQAGANPPRNRRPASATRKNVGGWHES